MPGPEIALLLACAFLAGLVDAVVGGGGLIQLPGLLVLLPAENTVTLLGTNKMSSIAGTSSAVWQYAQRVSIPWNSILPAALLALVCSYCGAWLASMLNTAQLRPLILILLIAVAIYTFRRKDFGALHAPKLSPTLEFSCSLLIGGVIGFYDGFFGPGTGSFLIFAFIGGLGYSFLTASAAAKVINFATNVGAIARFGASGHILYSIAIPMGICNVLGSLVGTHLALQHGAAFVRKLFMAIVILLIAKIAYDTWGSP